nr:MAG TPA: hypothetical protein [Caudoviricetes sp.]
MPEQNLNSSQKISPNSTANIGLLEISASISLA